MSYIVLIVNRQFEFCCLSWEQAVYAYLGRNDAEVNILSQRNEREEHDKKNAD